MTKALRTGKVLIDWSQNNGSKTTVAPYSLRARQFPTVSTPVSWDEVAACRQPQDLFFTADAVLDRVADHGDLFAPLLPASSTARDRAARRDPPARLGSQQSGVLMGGLRADRAPLAEQQQRVRGDGGVVGDQALADHLLEPGPGHPGLAHVLLLGLPLRRPRLEPGGQEVVPGLAADAVRAVQVPEPDQLAGAQPGLLRELQPGELLGLARLPVRPAALRERPGAPPDRVAVLLDQVEAVVLGRDDQREVALLARTRRCRGSRRAVRSRPGAAASSCLRRPRRRRACGYPRRRPEPASARAPCSDPAAASSSAWRPLGGPGAAASLSAEDRAPGHPPPGPAVCTGRQPAAAAPG